ncbi:MAG: aminopeptidase, partial [Thermoplasmata archaeon]|nr:aminopeptidase [Thermoplasmata archaeon]
MSKVNGAKVAIETCLNVKKGERVLILTDVAKEAIGDSLFQAAMDVGAETILAKIPEVKKDGQEPSAPVAKLMRDMDVIVITTEMSMSHTAARRRASKAGA